MKTIYFINELNSPTATFYKLTLVLYLLLPFSTLKSVFHLENRSIGVADPLDCEDST